ncbi:MAG: hypothetical protein BWY75_01979 [bacterium ADurb.Bin425]|nr:MAG: hypothetical protein BWY75_01979 [bacterium ADurb.Bin425]
MIAAVWFNNLIKLAISVIAILVNALRSMHLDSLTLGREFCITALRRNEHHALCRLDSDIAICGQFYFATKLSNLAVFIGKFVFTGITGKHPAIMEINLFEGSTLVILKLSAAGYSTDCIHRAVGSHL